LFRHGVGNNCDFPHSMYRYVILGLAARGETVEYFSICLQSRFSECRLRGFIIFKFFFAHSEGTRRLTIILPSRNNGRHAKRQRAGAGGSIIYVGPMRAPATLSEVKTVKFFIRLGGTRVNNNRSENVRGSTSRCVCVDACPTRNVPSRSNIYMLFLVFF